MDHHNTAHHTKDNNVMAILTYLGILILIPALTSAKDDPYVKFHVKQGLVLIISWVVGSVLGGLPVFGHLLSGIFSIFNFILAILGIINAATGKQKELPVIGLYARYFNF